VWRRKRQAAVAALKEAVLQSRRDDARIFCRSHATVLAMPVLNEDTFALMCLIEQSDPLYDDCFRITSQTLKRFPPSGDRSQGIGIVAASARAELSSLLRNVLRYCDDASIQDLLADASVDWRDIAREFIADVLCDGE
jgi:hypothetical protein